MPGNQSDSVAFNLVRPEFATNSINKALMEGSISDRDAELIQKFCAEMQATNGISIPRVNKLTYTIVALRRFVGEYEKNSIDDIYRAIPIIKTSKTNREKHYKQNTIVDFVKILKQFYIWASLNGYSTIPVEKIKMIKNPAKNEMTKTAADILTPDEVAAFIKSCISDRDRAFFMTLYEGGFRVGELGTLTWGQVKFDKYGAVINVDFKTGKPRYVRLLMAVEYLAKWRSVYPFTPEGTALVFLNKDNKPLTHAQVARQIERIVKRANIKKHITAHLFRHTRITDMQKDGISESVIKQVMWGSVESRMFKSYLHLTGPDVDTEILRTYGIDIPDKPKERTLSPLQCPNCKDVNSPVSNYCKICGHCLTRDAQSEQDSLNHVWLEKPEITAQWAKERIADKQRQLA
jgi:integrase/recombinase XerD